jgi:hypothetical protein
MCFLAAAFILILVGGQVRASAASQEAAQPIPSIAELMKELLANQDQVDRLRENYSCTDARIVHTLDKHGNVKKTETYVYQVSFLGGLEVDRLIEKDGRPLDADAQKKEDERNAREMKKYEKEQADKAAGISKEKDRVAVTIQDFLRADEFIHPRRENRAGEELIVFDFERNPNYKARSLTEKVAQALAGTVWIDAKAHEVAQLDAHLEDDVKVGAGLVASLHKGSAVSFVQTLVDQQVWLPTYIAVRLSARALLFIGMNIDQTDQYSAYLKFHVNVHTSVAPPTRQNP